MRVTNKTIGEGIDSSKKEGRGLLWAGPSGDGENGGVTQGLLGRFL